MLYQNKADFTWRRVVHDSVPPGGVFTPTEQELYRFNQHPTLFAHLVPVEEPTAAPDSSVKTPATVGKLPGVEQQQNPQWTLRMDPVRYLQLYPEGDHAPLANAIVAQRSAASRTESN